MLLQAAIAANHVEVLPLEIEKKEAALCRIDDSPALWRTGAGAERRQHSTVGQDVYAFAAEDDAGRPTAVGGIEDAIAIETDVAQDERALVGDTTPSAGSSTSKAP
jgi:hypothetical protein